ncbi:MAG: MFS transporter [Actinobacteria bacterium]|nr:MFS transporter [Actinomycetota bacterium]
MARRPPPPHHPNGHPERWRILAVLCAALCIVALDNTILAVAVPRLGEALGADETALQWITAAYGLVLAALLLPLAGLGDRFGRKGLLLVGLTLFGVASVAAARSTSTSQLVAARALMGIGGAATMPATLSVLGNVFADHERGRAIALWSGVASIAGGAGPLVGGFLLAHFWWGSVFLVNVPVILGVFAAVAILVPTSRDPASPPVDVVGSVLWAAALGLVLFALIQGGEAGGIDVSLLAVLALGLALLATFAAWERRCPHPLLVPAVVADRRMQAGIVVVPTVFFCVFGAQFVLTQWLQGVQQLTPLAAGLCFVPNAALIFAGSLLSTRLVAAVGLGRSAATGLLVLAAALVGGGLFHASLPPVLVAIAVAGFGVGLATPPGVELIMGSVAPHQAGQAAGINETIVEAGGALGIAVTGTVLALAVGGVGRISPEQLAGPDGHAARQLFSDALVAPMLAAAALCLAAAVAVVRLAAHVGPVAAHASDSAGTVAP